MNLITISNSIPTVTLDACGAVPHGIVKDGAEYLWQGSAKYRARRDANPLPYVGCLTDGQYLPDGKAYPIHLELEGVQEIIPVRSCWTKTPMSPMSLPGEMESRE